MSALSPRDSGAPLRALTEKIEVLLGERGNPDDWAVRRSELAETVERVFASLLKEVGVVYGTGSPEGQVTANVGILYRRLDGGASTTLYVKQSGTGNTGWAAK